MLEAWEADTQLGSLAKVHHERNLPKNSNDVDVNHDVDDGIQPHQRGKSLPGTYFV